MLLFFFLHPSHLPLLASCGCFSVRDAFLVIGGLALGHQYHPSSPSAYGPVHQHHQAMVLTPHKLFISLFFLWITNSGFLTGYRSSPPPPNFTATTVAKSRTFLLLYSPALCYQNIFLLSAHAEHRSPPATPTTETRLLFPFPSSADVSALLQIQNMT